MDQIEKLKIISDKTGISVAELVRLGINMLIKNYTAIMEGQEDD